MPRQFIGVRPLAAGFHATPAAVSMQGPLRPIRRRCLVALLTGAILLATGCRASNSANEFGDVSAESAGSFAPDDNASLFSAANLSKALSVASGTSHRRRRRRRRASVKLRRTGQSAPIR